MRRAARHLGIWQTNKDKIFDGIVNPPKDIPLGQGSFDMKRVVAILKQAKPDIRMMLELITRDPLKVPCLTDQFWATMPHVSGQDLARTLRLVRDYPAKSLQSVGALSLNKQVELEDANIKASLAYAIEELAL